MQLANNRELYDYMVSLRKKLIERGAQTLAQTVMQASRHFSGMSTEFLGESRIALREVAKAEGGVLDRTEHAELLGILKEIDFAFSRR